MPNNLLKRMLRNYAHPYICTWCCYMLKAYNIWPLFGFHSLVSFSVFSVVHAVLCFYFLNFSRLVLVWLLATSVTFENSGLCYRNEFHLCYEKKEAPFEHSHYGGIYDNTNENKTHVNSFLSYSVDLILFKHLWSCLDVVQLTAEQWMYCKLMINPHCCT